MQIKMEKSSYFVKDFWWWKVALSSINKIIYIVKEDNLQI